MILTVFKDTDPKGPPERRFMARHERDRIGIVFWGPTKKAVEDRAAAWIAAETEKIERLRAEAKAAYVPKKSKRNQTTEDEQP